MDDKERMKLVRELIKLSKIVKNYGARIQEIKEELREHIAINVPIITSKGEILKYGKENLNVINESDFIEAINGLGFKEVFTKVSLDKKSIRKQLGKVSTNKELKELFSEHIRLEPTDAIRVTVYEEI